jgi:DNA-binding CsgD family transcriptional regulator/tetratricopeptide (TPR) repeat protein
VHGGVLIEREAERTRLGALLQDARAGRGALVLLTGEAGVGKTRFAEEVAGAAGVRLLRGAAGPGAPPYGPVTAALRDFLRAAPDGLAGCGPLRAHLALLLPELGEPIAESDRPTLFEAIRGGLAGVVTDAPAVVLLDDLQWSDDATLELLAAIASPLRELPLLVLAAYRSDEIPRVHQLRRLRDDLRRNHLLLELALEPLSAAGTALLAERMLGSPPSPRLAATLHDRTGGLPFFVEELAGALQAGGRLRAGSAGLELSLDADVPLPQTIRDAVLLRASGLSAQARATAEAAAVAGTRFDVEVVAALGTEAGMEELLASGVIVELEPGRAAFRHPLARDAIYEDVPWLRRRSLHRALAAALEARDGEHAEVAAHWLSARDDARALDALVRAVAERAAVHAYRDAARLGRQALDRWPEGERGAERIAVLERHARFAELAGELTEATRAQREVVAARRAEGAGRALAVAERALAGIYELRGDRERALTARRVAADAFAANGFPGEAAAERLSAAGYLVSAGKQREAVELTGCAGDEAGRAERIDLRVRVLGLQGIAQVKGGEFAAGLEAIRAGLSLALEHELTLEAAELYQRLGTAHEIAGDYGGARAALDTAVGFCESSGADGLKHTCIGCLAYVLRELGDWDRAAELSDGLLLPDATSASTLVADGVLGAILAFRGDLRAARPLLVRSLDTASRLDVVSMAVDSAAALAWLEEREGGLDHAREHCRYLLERWARSEDHHYAVWGLRWAACFFARDGRLSDARACAEALSSIAARTGHSDALAALAHALGETALADGHADAAAEQLCRAAELHATLEIPYERAHILLRAGVALAAAGQREAALDRLAEAHRTARRLGAAPLAADVAAEVARLGESVERRLGRRAAADLEHAGLSARELEVMRRVASGATNREIAVELVLSTRTVDMHVRNILAKLRCRSRTEAVAKAGDLGLLTPSR